MGALGVLSSAGVRDLERQRSGPGYAKQASALDLHLLEGAPLHGLVRDDGHALDVHDALLRHVRDVLDHAFADDFALLVDEKNDLDCRRTVPENDEGALALAPHGVEPAAEADLARFVAARLDLGREILEGSEDVLVQSLGLNEGKVAVLVGEGVGLCVRCEQYMRRN